MFFIKTPELLINALTSVTWRVPASNAIYLTFDDGPNPMSTPTLLQTLEEYNIKASFFCLGCNAEKYPELINLIRQKGHTVASHGYNHISGWKSSTKKYIENAKKASDYLPTKLFRPPYGRMTPNQFSKLKKWSQIIMWDIMPGDFNPEMSVNKCVSNIVDNIRDGSIIVLHDRPDIKQKTKKIIESLTSKIDREYKALDSF